MSLPLNHIPYFFQDESEVGVERINDFFIHLLRLPVAYLRLSLICSGLQIFVLTNPFELLTPMFILIFWINFCRQAYRTKSKTSVKLVKKNHCNLLDNGLKLEIKLPFRFYF